MTRRVTGPLPGQVITSRFLRRVADNQNELLEKFRGPRDVLETVVETGETGQVDGALDEVWNERSRTTSTVRIESDSDSSVFVNVQRVESITLAKSGGGEVTIHFDNL